MSDKTHEESAVLKMIGQYLELVLVFLRKLHPLGLTSAQITALVKDKNHPFWVAFNEATKLLATPEVASISFDDDTNRQVNFWKAFYKTHFGIDLDMAGVKIPARKAGFGWLVIVAQGISLNQVWEVCRKQFDCWKYTDSDLESVMQESERGEAEAMTVRWFRDRVEADEEMKNLSARELAKQNITGITLIERLLLELKYFSETKKHLNIKNWTLCSGSRCADGFVPDVFWHSGDRKLFVYWSHVDDRGGGLRSRVAVTL